MANITYRQVNDFMIPNLTLPPEEAQCRQLKEMKKKDAQKRGKIIIQNAN